MEFADVVRRRRMVRSYRADPVPEEVLERVLRTARRAPSAGFSQGQYLVVVTDEGTRRAIAHLADEEGHVAKGLEPWMSQAPVHVVVCVREDDYHERYNEPDKVTAEGNEIEWPVPYWWVDVGGSMMMLLLAAVDEGLGAGFFGWHRLEGVTELLGIPDDVAPIGVVTLGYATDDQPAGSATRGWKPFEHVVRRDRWEQGWS